MKQQRCLKNEICVLPNLVKLAGLFLDSPHNPDRNIRYTRISVGVVNVERQGFISLRASEHCKEHVFWHTCETSLLLLH